jgi:two-component system, sensor histidine kinase
VWVDGDPTRIEQIVVNLVENAVKHTKDECTIAVAVGAESGDAVLRVRDDGAGMAPELVARVFDLFVQGDHGLDRASGGLGIGLTLVQRLAVLHGGSVEAASDGLGHGSTFTVRFPAIQPSESAEYPSPQFVRQGPARDVLVIEDNDDGRVALCQLLELGGHRVRAVGDGVNGIALAREAPPEIVLVDIGLPGIDGYEVARQLRASLPAVLLVAVTGYGLPEDQQRAYAAGFDLYLVKPVDLAMLSLLLDSGTPTRSGSSALPW